MRVYRNSLAFLLAKNAAELFPKARLTVDHSFGTGFYCGFETPDKAQLTAAQTRRLEEAMRRDIRRNIPIKRYSLAFSEAVDKFEQTGWRDKADLLRFRNPPAVVIHECGEFSDLAQNPLASTAGILKLFKLRHYPPGLVLQFPDQSDIKRMASFRDQPHLFRIFQEHKQWGRIVGVTNVGKLNELIYRGDIAEFIRMAEAFHEKKIARMADQIAARRDRLKVILIAGPSAAGKTSLAKRLAVQLQVNGIVTSAISLDNYYVNDADTPHDPTGRPDYEHIDAIDVPMFNRHLQELINGREVELPFFNFNTKLREFRGDNLRLAPEQMVIVEGIHGLNPKFTPMISADKKFKIYISALTQLNIDNNNRISTTDNRLMRRMARDYQYRGNSALATLRMWPSVRYGEKKWIFPFQAEADAVFNSALDYELAVLKPMVLPLLMTIKPTDPEYAETRRLQGFLDNFLDAPVKDVPATSILREYIGSSSFKY